MKLQEELIFKLFNSDLRSIVIECSSRYKISTVFDLIKGFYCDFEKYNSFCGTCKNCSRLKSLHKSSHPDVLLYLNDSFTIADSRDLIEKTSIFPFEKPFRFVIISFEKASNESLNALLKLLEEDGSAEVNSKFIIFVRDSGLLLDTILSRSTLVTLASETKDQFHALVVKKGFNKKEMISFVSNYQEKDLSNLSFLKEKFNLDLEELFVHIDKAFRLPEPSAEFFKCFEKWKQVPFKYAYRLIEFIFIRNSRTNLQNLMLYQEIFMRGNSTYHKECKLNEYQFLLMHYFFHKKILLDKFIKKAKI